jgi:hypothetical protein
MKIDVVLVRRILLSDNHESDGLVTLIRKWIDKYDESGVKDLLELISLRTSKISVCITLTVASVLLFSVFLSMIYIGAVAPGAGKIALIVIAASATISGFMWNQLSSNTISLRKYPKLQKLENFLTEVESFIIPGTHGALWGTYWDYIRQSATDRLHRLIYKVKDLEKEHEKDKEVLSVAVQLNEARIAMLEFHKKYAKMGLVNRDLKVCFLDAEDKLPKSSEPKGPGMEKD